MRGLVILDYAHGDMLCAVCIETVTGIFSRKVPCHNTKNAQYSLYYNKLIVVPYY